jgi:TRAP-type C4-dicarboxylate transport system permease small subunit
MKRMVENKNMNNKFLKFINSISKAFHGIGAVLLGFIFLIIVLEVIMRPFGKSFLAVGEVTEYAIVWCIFLALPYITTKNRHIKVDLITRLFPIKTQKILCIISNIFCIAFAVLLFWKGSELVYGAYIYDSRTVMLGLPEYLLKAVLPLSMVFFILELVADIIKIIDSLKVNKESKDTSDVCLETTYEEAKKEAFVE